MNYNQENINNIREHIQQQKVDESFPSRAYRPMESSSSVEVGLSKSSLKKCSDMILEFI